MVFLYYFTISPETKISLIVVVTLLILNVILSNENINVFFFQLSRKLILFCVVKKGWSYIWIRPLPNLRKSFTSLYNLRSVIKLWFYASIQIWLSFLYFLYRNTNTHICTNVLLFRGWVLGLSFHLKKSFWDSI